MTQCKSIRKDDVNVTATQLGVKVGDKFVVLSKEDYYDNEELGCKHTHLNDGDVVVLTRDDESCSPWFTNLNTGNDNIAINFARLARYEEKQEQEEDGVVNNSVSLYTAEYYSAECIEQSFGEGYGSEAKFVVKGLTQKQYSDILSFINNMK